MTTLNIHKFNLDNLKIGHRIGIIGQAFSGKTTIVNSILKKFKDTDAVVSYFNEENLDDLNALLETIASHIKLKLTPKPNILVFENIGWFSKKLLENSAFRKLFQSVKQFNIMMILTDQCSFEYQMRINLDYICLTKNCNVCVSRKQLYEQYEGMAPTLEIFNILLDNSTQDYSCLVVQNNTLCYKMENLFWYKPTLNE